MAMNTVDDLFEEQLRDLYSAENQLIKALPKMAKKASSETLQEAFESHLEETRGHVERLQEIGQSLGIKLGGHKCEAMAGLIKEGSEVLEEDGEDAVIDAALVACAQRVEHYEISAYGTTRSLAERLGHSEAVDLLQQTLDEEGACDKKLTEICQDELLPSAPTGADSGEGEEDDDGATASRSGSAGAAARGRAAGGRSGGGAGRSGSAGSRGSSRSGGSKGGRGR